MNYSVKYFLVLVSFILFKQSSQSCSDPLITSWVKSTGSAKNGSAKGLPADVQTIAYDTSYVYIYASGIPSYSIGPWASNPNSAGNKARYIKISRASSLGSASVPSTKTSTPMGPIGYLINGVPIYNMQDGFSYNNKGVWQRNAYAYEGISFDSCGGHPDPTSSYHNHVDPNCLYTKNSGQHSPIIGWMLDGYPLYGPYGYATGSRTVKLMKTGYAKRTDMNGVRQTLLSNTGITTQLTSDKYGPAIDLTQNLTIPWSGSTYPLGAFIQDYVWSNNGDLDAYNGRANSITPEYPNGVYAYYLPLDSSLKPTVPYIVGPSYYGQPITTSGSIPSTATTYFSYSSNTNADSCGGSPSVPTTTKAGQTTTQTCVDSQSACKAWANFCFLLKYYSPHPCKKTCKLC